MGNDLVFHDYRPPELQPRNAVIDGRANPNRNAYIERFKWTYRNVGRQ